MNAASWFDVARIVMWWCGARADTDLVGNYQSYCCTTTTTSTLRGELSNSQQRRPRRDVRKLAQQNAQCSQTSGMDMYM